MKNKYLSIRTNAQTLHELKTILDYANESLLPAQKRETKTSMIEGLIHFAYETMPKDEGETIVGMSQETEDERIERLYSYNEGEIGQYEKSDGESND